MTDTPRPLRLDNAQRGAFLGAFIGWLFDYYEVFLLTFLIVPIGKEFKLSGASSAWIVSASLIAMAVGGVLFGPLGDRIGRRRVLMVTVLTYTLATFARALAPNYPTLLVLTLIAGMGLGGEYGVGQSLITEMIDPRRRGWWSGLFYNGAYVSIMLASLVGGQILPRVGWRWTFALSGLPVLLVIYLRTRTPESPAWQRSAQAREPGTYSSKAFLVPLMKCLAAAILYFWAYYGITTLLPKYLVSLGFSMSNASWWIFFTAVAGLLGGMFGAWASDRWGRRPTLTLVMSLAALGGLIVYFLGQTMLGSAWILIPFFILYFGSTAPSVFGTLFSEVFPTRLRSSGVSAALQIARGTSAVPPLIAAAMISSVGYTFIFLASALLYAGVAALAWAFPETRTLNLATIDRQESTAARVHS